MCSAPRWFGQMQRSSWLDGEPPGSSAGVRPCSRPCKDSQAGNRVERRKVAEAPENGGQGSGGCALTRGKGSDSKRPKHSGRRHNCTGRADRYKKTSGSHEMRSVGLSHRVYWNSTVTVRRSIIAQSTPFCQCPHTACRPAATIAAHYAWRVLTTSRFAASTLVRQRR